MGKLTDARRTARVSAPITLGVLATLATIPLQADPALPPPITPFDGQWVINADTSSALCPVKTKKLTAFVYDGKVIAVWGLPGTPKASGKVESDGSVEIKIQTLGVNAAVRGKVLNKQGQGAWSSDSVLCSKGKWRASID